MTVRLTSASLHAEISSLGAELTRLQDEDGRDLLWSGDPAVWAGRSPLLFPIVGAVKDDRIQVDGHHYTLKKHGFARTSVFEVVETTSSLARFRLASSEAIREVYPFDFLLEVVYRIEGHTLSITATVTNPGQRPLPASFGFHPAFRWPLPYGGTKDDHEIRFEHAEPAPIRRLNGSLIGREAHPTPMEGHRLALQDELFATDALILDQLASRAVEYGVPGRHSIRVTFPNIPHLGIWTKPGAPFICIEPWHGYASPEDFDGEFFDKPGIVLIPAGAAKAFQMDISITPSL